jgi:PAS domain S-box-containing protein
MDTRHLLLSNRIDLAPATSAHCRMERCLHVDAIPTQVWTLAPDGALDFVNARVLEYTGLPSDEILAKGLLQVVHPDDIDRFNGVLTGLLQTGRGGEVEVRLRRQDGDFRWFLVCMTCSSGKWHGTNTDIHDTGKVRDANERPACGQVEPLKDELDSPMTQASFDGLAQQMASTRDTAAGQLRSTGSVTDAVERKQAADALRASEHLARGQLESLTRTLDALAQEADPDRLLEHVMSMISDQSRAHSVSIWERDGENETLSIVAVIENGRFRSRGEGLDPAARLPLLVQTHPVWIEVFRTGRHVVLEDIEGEAARMRAGSDTNAPWHRVELDTDPDSGIALVRKHLARLGVRSILTVPMLLAGRVTGVVGVRFAELRNFREEEIELTRALAHQAMLAIQLTRLSRQAREAAVMAERNRFARDMHDTLAQGFTGVIVQLEAAADAAVRGLGAEAMAHVDRAQNLARESLKDARRSVLALRPQALEQGDLCQALTALIHKMTEGTATLARLRVSGRRRELPREWEENLLRIGQELLTNALRHARSSTIEADLTFTPSEVRFEFRDDGVGFDPSVQRDGFGLQGIQERVVGMGGSLLIDSIPGGDTCTTIALPCTQQRDKQQT